MKMPKQRNSVGAELACDCTCLQEIFLNSLLHSGSPCLHSSHADESIGSDMGWWPWLSVSMTVV